MTDQVGDAFPFGAGRHAVRWQGTPESMVVLTPKGYGSSWAVDTDGEYQVGTAVSSGVRPALWRGTAESFVDMTPAGYESGEMFGIADGQQVGYAARAGQTPKPLAHATQPLRSGGWFARPAHLCRCSGNADGVALANPPQQAVER